MEETHRLLTNKILIKALYEQSWYYKYKKITLTHIFQDGVMWLTPLSNSIENSEHLYAISLKQVV